MSNLQFEKAVCKPPITYKARETHIPQLILMVSLTESGTQNPGNTQILKMSRGFDEFSRAFSRTSPSKLQFHTWDMTHEFWRILCMSPYKTPFHFPWGGVGLTWVPRDLLARNDNRLPSSFLHIHCLSSQNPLGAPLDVDSRVFRFWGFGGSWLHTWTRTLGAG